MGAATVRNRLAALCWLGVTLAIIGAVACGGREREHMSHNGDEQGSSANAAQHEQSSRNAPATQLSGAPVPDPDAHVTVEGLMSGGHVAWLTERVLCPEEELVSSELDVDYVTTLGLADDDEVPDDLRAYLLEELSLDVDTVEHRWIVEDRLILFKVTPWTNGDAEIAAAAIEVQRLTVSPGWAVSEAGFAFYCS